MGVVAAENAVNPDGIEAKNFAKQGLQFTKNAANAGINAANAGINAGIDAANAATFGAAKLAAGVESVADSSARIVKSAEDIGQAGVDAAEKIGQAGVRVGKAVAPYVKKGVETGLRAAETGAEVGLEVGAVAAAAAGGGFAYDIAQSVYGGYSGGSSYSGGCGYFGGDKDDDPILSIKDFSQSRAFETKDQVIKQLAKALSSVGINVNENDDADTIVKALVSQIPNPKNGKTFSSDAESQAKVCKAVATALNNVFTPFATKPEDKLIDPSLGTVEMCRLVGEWAHSFSIGVNTEFLAVHASVKNALRAVVMYDGVMSQLWSKIQDKMQLDDNMDRELSPLIEVYNRAQSERRRQELLLNNILHTNLDPADRELANAMADDSKQNILIKKLGLRPGTTEFADTLAMAISGLGTAASIAQRVNKALKTVGMSINEYLSGKDYKEFQNMLDSKFEELIMNKKNLNSKEIHKFLKAAATIRDSFDHKNDSRFKNALNGRQDNIMGGADDDEDDPDGAPITSTGKMVKEFNAEKKNIINEFVKRMSKNYEELLIPIKAMSRKLGTEIPVTDKTDVLRDSLVRLSEMYDEHQKIELSLIGAYKTANDRQRKARYVNNLRALAVACSSLMENALYSSVTSYFVQLKEAISKIQKTIDYFSDIITSKYGGEVEGGGDDDLLAGEIAKSTLILKEVVNEFAYFYYIANVKSNFEQTSAELDKYSVKYNELLGDAVASRIYTLEKDYRKIMAKNFKETTAARGDDDEEAETSLLDQGQGVGQRGVGQIGVGQRAAEEVALGGTPDEKIKAARKKWIKAEYDCKIKFYRVLQAIDLYMKAFTSAIVKDPNAVRDIKKILDSTQVIARWFNEETGNNIWKSFEMMDARTSENVNTIKEFTSGHYYEFVRGQEVRATANNILHPLPTHQYSQTLNSDSSEKNTLTQAQKYIDQSIDFYQGLKNLVNAFIRIGDIFGGNELHSQSFMSPSQIFQGLTKFLKQSALSSDTDIKIVTFSDVDSPNFKVESIYFALIIKSMAAKILTTLGVYDMFERSTPITEINHTRIITGGALETPEVLEGASELYFRLPRLIEFYRRFLYWDGESDTDVYKIIKDSEDKYKIAMLPELEGIFANIIRLIFQKAVSADIGEYSDSELRNIVVEINHIYSHFHEKKPGQATKSALSEFVIEINRRYGVIKKKDMQDYWKMIRKESKPQELSKGNDTNYAILPNENQTEINRRAPSDRYLVQQANAIDFDSGLPINPRTQKTFDPYIGRIDLELKGAKIVARTLVEKFREELDKVYSKSETNSRGRAVYSLMIHQAEIEIKQAASADAKLKIAFRLIQGADKIATDINKAVMFHETVIVGLSSLNAIYVILSRFSDKLLTMNPVTIEKAIMDASYLFTLGLTKNNKQITNKIYSHDLPDDINEMIKEVLPKYAASRSSKLTIDPNNISSTSTCFSEYIDRSKYEYFTPGRTMTVKSLEDRKALLASSFIYDKTGDRYAAANDNYENILVNSDNLSLLGSIEITGGAGGPQVLIEHLQNLKVMAYKTVKYDEIMTDFIELVYGLSTSTQGLVEVRFTQNNNDGYIQFGFSKLKELVENIMIDVKLYFEQFRPYFSKTLIEKYENKTKVGSIFWLEENLFDKMIRPPFDDKLKSNSLSGISRRANSIFQGLLRNHGYKLRKSDPQLNYSIRDHWRVRSIVDFNEGDDVKLCHHAYGNALSQLLYYGDESFLYKKYDGYDKSTYPLSNLMSTGRPNKATTRDPEPEMKHPKMVDDNATVRYLFYDSEESFTQHRSILFLFNQLMARYLNTVVDKSGEERVYFPLINSIANGVMSNSVTNPGKETFPDILSMLADDISLKIGGPKPTAILFHSLALILQRLIKDSNPITQVSYHLLSTLTDVPLYMKESYRVNLPGFVKLFDFVYQKCEFIKQFIQKTPNLNLSKMELRDIRDNKLTVKAGIEVGGDFTGVPSEKVNVMFPRDSLSGIKEFNDTLSDKDVREYFLEFIDSVSNACYVVSNSAIDVLKELGDMPVYGQLYENSIEMYQNRNGKLPLTPISIIFSFLANIKTSGISGGTPEDIKRSVLSDPLVFPNKTLGDPKFKLLYANRQVIMQSTQIGYDQIPGVKAIVDTYNSVSSSTDRLDDERYLRFLNNVITGVRFVVDIRSYKVQMTSTYCFPSISYISTATATAAAAVAAVGATVPTAALKIPITNLADNATVTIYFMDKLPSAIISSLETAAQTDTYTEIAKHVDGDKSKSTANDRRQQERVDNLMDMNIIPINVHALMRDIPLVNLYNYDFTFNQMLDDMYLKSSTAENSTNLASQLFIELTKDPYKALPSNDTVRFAALTTIFDGGGNLGLGRPKFLSDQIHNKVLLGGVYLSQGQPIRFTDNHLVVVKRFNTTFIRNLFFITNITRIVRLKLNRELSQSRNVIVSSHSAVATSVTEYGTDPFGTDETYDSTRLNGQTRYNDDDVAI